MIMVGGNCPGENVLLETREGGNCPWEGEIVRGEVSGGTVRGKLSISPLSCVSVSMQDVSSYINF